MLQVFFVSLKNSCNFDIWSWPGFARLYLYV